MPSFLPRLWPFRRNPNRLPRTPSRNLVASYTTEGWPDVVSAEYATPIPFPRSVSELPNLKHHALRALCGAMMDRDSGCLLDHPFCFPLEHAAANIVTLIAEVACLQNGPEDYVVGIYMSRAVARMPESEDLWDPQDYALSLDYAGTVPDRMMAVRLLPGGNYFAHYGANYDPVPGEYSTGTIDHANWTTLFCDPEPARAKHTYWPNEITEGQQIVPQFKCLMLRGEWWIFDCDMERGIAQQVAALEVADNSDHILRLMPYRRS